MKNFFRSFIRHIVKEEFENLINSERALNESITAQTLKSIDKKLTGEIKIFGDASKVKINPTANMVNTLFNTSSGIIEVGAYTFTGHNVCLITGTHDYKKTLENRITAVPQKGRDIIIGKGVWICSNVTVLGPCAIGDNAVVAAGSVVKSNTDIPKNTIFAGIPAKKLKDINPEY
jgi:acetyltransferase-like isoleucine patch superfamily enzyme